MNAVLYCYDWDSVNGYTYAFADTQQRKLFSYTQAKAQFPDRVIRLIGNGGASLVSGYDAQSENFYLVLKRINNGKKDRDGRQIDSNIAFLSQDADEMFVFTKGLLAQYRAVETAFQKLLTPDPSYTVGYGIDFDLFQLVIDSCIELGKLSDTETVWVIQYSRAKPFSFVVTDYDLAYFTKMNKVDPKDVSDHVKTAGRSFSASLQNTRTGLHPVTKPDLEKRVATLNERMTTDEKRLNDGDIPNQINALKQSVEELNDRIDRLSPVIPGLSGLPDDIKQKLDSLDQRILSLKKQTPATDSSEVRTLRTELEDVKKREKKTRRILLAALVVAALSLILSIIAMF